LGGRRVLDWAVDAARVVADGTVLVVPGGATRSESVRAGLQAVPPDADVVVVHDAARPCATPALVRAVVDAVASGRDGAVPGVPPVDTVKRVAGDMVLETLDRGTLVTVQTPQAFRAEVLRRAHEGAADATDDAALVEAAGGRVVTVPGDPANRKVTVPDDLVWARQRVVGEQR